MCSSLTLFDELSLIVQEPGHFLMPRVRQKDEGLFLSQNFVLYLKIHFLRSTDLTKGVKIEVFGVLGLKKCIFPQNSLFFFPFSPPRQVRYQNEGNGTGNLLQHIVWKSKLFVWI